MATELWDRIERLAPAFEPGPWVVPEGDHAAQGIPPMNIPVAAAMYDAGFAQHVLGAVARFGGHSRGNDGNIARLLRYSLRLPETAPRTDVTGLTAIALEHASNLVDSAQQHVDTGRGGPDAHRDVAFVPAGHPRAHGFDLLDPDPKIDMLQTQEEYNSCSVSLVTEIGLGNIPTVLRATLADMEKGAWRLDAIAEGTRPYSEHEGMTITSSSLAGIMHRGYGNPTTDAHAGVGIFGPLNVPAV